MFVRRMYTYEFSHMNVCAKNAYICMPYIMTQFPSRYFQNK